MPILSNSKAISTIKNILSLSKIWRNTRHPIFTLAVKKNKRTQIWGCKNKKKCHQNNTNNIFAYITRGEPRPKRINTLKGAVDCSLSTKKTLMIVRRGRLGKRGAEVNRNFPTLVFVRDGTPNKCRRYAKITRKFDCACNFFTDEGCYENNKCGILLFRCQNLAIFIFFLSRENVRNFFSQ